MKKKNPILTLAVIFLIVALALMAAGGIVYAFQQSFKDRAVQTQAVIDEIYRTGSGDDVSHTVYVTFETREGRTIRAELGYYSSSMEEGDEVTLFYDPEEPGKVLAESSQLVPVILGIVGAVFLALSIGMLISGLYRIARRKRLKRDGRQVYAEIVAICQDTSYSVNNVHPYRVSCKAYFGGKLWEIRSEPIWQVPGLQVGGRVVVLYDENNPKIHCIDPDSLIGTTPR